MIQAVGEYICVEILPEDTTKKTDSGIYIAEEERKRRGDVVFCKRGKVVSAGDDVNVHVAIGDIVLYNPYDIGEFDNHGLLNYKLIKAVLKD